MKVSKTAIFLFELMVVILVFSLAAAVCTSIFSKAYGFSRESKDLTMAVLEAESVAEEFKDGKVPTSDLLFDKDWKRTTDEGEDKDTSAYFIRTETEQKGPVNEMTISVKKTGEGGVGPSDIYVLKVKAYDE
jgi:type II secretory pathway pseudopilin PulG